MCKYMKVHRRTNFLVCSNFELECVLIAWFLGIYMGFGPKLARARTSLWLRD